MKCSAVGRSICTYCTECTLWSEQFLRVFHKLNKYCTVFTVHSRMLLIIHVCCPNLLLFTTRIVFPFCVCGGKGIQYSLFSQWIPDTPIPYSTVLYNCIYSTYIHNDINNNNLGSILFYPNIPDWLRTEVDRFLSVRKHFEYKMAGFLNFIMVPPRVFFLLKIVEVTLTVYI